MMNLGIIIEIFLNMKRTREIGKNPMREEPDANKSKKEEARDLHYD